MKKTVKTGNVAVLLLGMVLALASCGPKGEAEDPRTGSGGGKGTIYENILKKVDVLNVETKWNESQKQYAEILNDWIPKLKKSPTQRVNLTNAAKIAYCHSMDTILYLHLSGDCAKLHDEMAEIVALRGDAVQFASVPASAFHDQVLAQYNEHQEMLDFVTKVGSYYKQKITSIKDKYNTKSESDVTNTAKAYQSKQPNCSAIVNGLDKILKPVKSNSIFKGWRKSYCKNLVDFYSKKTNRTEGDLNIMISSLHTYFMDVYPNDAYTGDLNIMIAEFRTEFEEKD